MKYNHEKDLTKHEKQITEYADYKKALRFASPEYRIKLEGFDRQIAERLQQEEARAAEAERKAHKRALERAEYDRERMQQAQVRFMAEEAEERIRIQGERKRRQSISWMFLNTVGRIGRGPYWAASLLFEAAGFVLALGLFHWSGSFAEDFFAVVFPAFLSAIGIAPMVKRLHDVNRSGWSVLWFFIPIGVLHSRLLMDSSRSVQMVWILWTLGAFIWAFLRLGFSQGTAGTNKYGEDPQVLKMYREEPGEGE
jgi:uncharacterized membrane protein YhaH (DUF805 family)